MIDNCLGILRKEGCPALREAIRDGNGSYLSYSALDCIIRSERYPGFLGDVDDIVLEAPYRSDLPWDELTVMLAMREARKGIRTTIFVAPEAHNWCLDPNIPPEGASALIERLSSHSLAPRLFTGPLSTLTRDELATGWHHLESGHQTYRMCEPPTPAIERTVYPALDRVLRFFQYSL